jgi:hypothetical protein
MSSRGLFQELQAKGFYETVPMALHTYANVFSKTAFDTLPQHQKWDHTIEIECKPSPGFRKVNPMTLTEQKEMDKSQEKVLATGCIRQSQLLLGVPVFFIEKKDGKLHSILDYHALNTIMCNNHYLLPLINDLIHHLKGIH